jgi:predicted small lipoprotein YifL
LEIAMRHIKTFGLLLVVSSFLLGCGQKGALYLPETEEPAQEQSSDA